MTGAAGLGLPAGAATTSPPARGGAHTATDPHTAASTPDAADTRTSAGRLDGAGGERGETTGNTDPGPPFADLLATTAPPSPTPAEPAPAQPTRESDDAAPVQLLALLDGHWLGTPARGLAGAATTAGPAASPHLAGAQTPLAAALASATGATAATLAASPDTAAADATTFPLAAPGVAKADAVALEAMVSAAGAGAAPDVADTGIQAPQPLAATRPAQAAPALPPLALPANADDGFDDGFGTRIAWMAEQRLGRAEIRLNPERVGPIDVRVQLDGDQVRAEFHSANAEVRQALEASLPRLRELLGQHGLQLDQADVGQGQAGRDGSEARPAGTGRGAADAGVGTSEESRPLQMPVRARGLVDAYA